MRTVNVHAAKTQLSQLLEEVQKGEEITIAKAGKPVARLVPFSAPRPARQPGILRGVIAVPPDEVWLPDRELESLFENSTLFPGDVQECPKDADKAGGTER
jgi:prevent-host-death family protein